MRIRRAAEAAAAVPLVVLLAVACGGSNDPEVELAGSPRAAATDGPAVRPTSGPSADAEQLLDGRKRSPTPTPSLTRPGTDGEMSPRPKPRQTRTSDPGPTRTTTATSAPDKPSTYRFTADNFRFHPARFTVPVGTRVTVVVTEGNHTWTSPQAGFDSGSLGDGQTYTYTFNRAGTFDFYCQPHRNLLMQGTVTVRS